MDGEHDGGVKERFKWGPHFHYFGDYTLGIVMLRTRGFFFTDYLSGLKQKPIKTSTTPL